MFHKSTCAALALFVMVGCAKQDDYRSESFKLCKAFDFSSWQLQPDDMPREELMKTLKQKIWSGVKSRKVSNIIKSASNQAGDKRYQYISAEISKLTGEKFDCPDMQSFFGATGSETESGAPE